MRFRSWPIRALSRLLIASLSGFAACSDSGGPRQPDAPDGGGNELPLVCDVVLPTSCPSPAPTYDRDVKQIIARRCGSCHDGRGEQWPLVDYSHVADWYDLLREQMSKCTMPPPDAGIEMPTSERETILEWIRCDVPER
ncbi:MAG: hypothetical protein QM778_29545 [Myxococcales bacterium]